MGPAARTTSGNLAPKPMLFFPGDPLAITFWRAAAAWNAGDIEALLALHDKKAVVKMPWPPAFVATTSVLHDKKVVVKMPSGVVLKGHDQLRSAIEQQLKESKGLVRAELGEFRKLPVLLMWRYEKGGTRTPYAMVRAKKTKNWVITRAEFDTDPKHLAKVQPSGLMPYDSAFMFDANDCIRTKETAYTPDGGLAILYGQLAPEGSVVKTAGISAEFKKNCGPGFVFEGPCVIFESQDDACVGILAGKVKAGDVVIIRNEGPRGGPGMQEMLSPTSYIAGLGLGDKCALITDGRFSGGTAGACICHVSPEAEEGGPIGLLKAGDRIRIDFPNRRIDILVSEAELAERKKTWQPGKRDLTGWLARYRKLVTNASQGGVLQA
ncbi:MAG: dihydroxy-acid dehydratase [Verrucomicrobiota bacterium]